MTIKTLILSQVDSGISESEVKTCFSSSIPVYYVRQFKSFFGDKEYRFPFFVIKTNNTGYEYALNEQNFIQIRGKICKFEEYSKFFGHCSVIVYGGTDDTSSEEIIEKFNNFGVQNVTKIQTNRGSVFMVLFNMKEQLERAISCRKCFVIKSNIFHTSMFPLDCGNYDSDSLFSHIPYSLCKNSLTIQYNNVEYSVPVVPSCAVSPVISKHMEKNPGKKLTIACIEGDFKSVVDILSGKEVNVRENPAFFYLISVVLDIKSLEYHVAKEYYESLCVNRSLFANIKICLANNRGIPLHINFVKNHYESVRKMDEFKQLENKLYAIEKSIDEEQRITSGKHYADLMMNKAIDLNDYRQKIIQLISSSSFVDES